MNPTRVPIPVYPRVCGGTRLMSLASPLVSGLSPRVRGNRHYADADSVAVRSIPACAGEPTSRRSGGRTRWVYPRVCGGTARRGRNRCSPFGLSPRVRGNRGATHQHLPLRRSIPACAGEPRSSASGWLNPSVYPRVCGGTPISCSLAYPLYGLSPRVRGNPYRVDRVGGCHRSIPACAGEPLPAHSTLGQRTVYPRVCGGTSDDDADAAHAEGLSPRVRGNHRLSRRRPRSTPVYPRVCGGTWRSRRRGVAPSVYPRVCGGTQKPALDGEIGLRSIPACAGEPAYRARWSIRRWVYPRVCGGTPSGSSMNPFMLGLSPRVRGNPTFPTIWP